MPRRATYMTGRAGYLLQAPDIEAAKHLRNVAAAYVKQRATAGDVEVAMTEFRAACAEKKAKET